MQQLVSIMGGNNFKLCKMKMQVVLFKQRCAKTLKGKTMLSASMSEEDKTKMKVKVRSVNVLCLNMAGPRGLPLKQGL